MTREERLQFCSVCQNRAFNLNYGTICKLTNGVATFEGKCGDYTEDPVEVNNLKEKEKIIIHNKKKTINKGRFSLFFIAGMFTLIGFLEAFVIQGHMLVFGIIDWTVALIFLGLGIWSLFHAYRAMITGLIVYAALNLLLAVLDPTTLYRGIIWKVMIVSFLIYGIKTANEERKNNRSKPADILDQI